jgi:hypothetical protein
MKLLAIAAAGLAFTAERPLDLRAQSFPGLADGPIEVGCMTMTSGHTLFGGKGFGGYSGVLYDDEAARLTLLSDAGHVLGVDATLSPTGQFIGFGAAGARLIETPDKGRDDTEALLPDGEGLIVVREARDDAVRVRITESAAAMTEVLTVLKTPSPLPNNKGFEAAAEDGAGGYLFIPEHQDKNSRAPILRHHGAWTELIGYYQGEEDFAVTDLAADPEGDRLFVLERAFNRALGPRARIKVLPLSLVREGDGGVYAPVELGRMTFFEGADNMEGLTFQTLGDGSGALILVSDDNFNPIQRTVLMVLRLSERCALAPA